MSSQPDNDPLAALAKATQKAVNSEGVSRAAAATAKEAATAGSRRLVRTVTMVVLVAIVGAVLITQGPRMADPYADVDPLAEPPQAKAYAAGLLDAVLEWRKRNHGELPVSLEQAVPASRLPPAASAYRVEYRVENGVPVITLRGGSAPLVLRGEIK